jgi:hypothetical protein
VSMHRPAGPDQLWIADFTQVATWQGVAYIAVVADARQPPLPGLAGAGRQDGRAGAGRS